MSLLKIFRSHKNGDGQDTKDIATQASKDKNMVEGRRVEPPIMKILTFNVERAKELIDEGYHETICMNRTTFVSRNMIFADEGDMFMANTDINGGQYVDVYTKNWEKITDVKQLASACEGNENTIGYVKLIAVVEDLSKIGKTVPEIIEDIYDKISIRGIGFMDNEPMKRAVDINNFIRFNLDIDVPEMRALIKKAEISLFYQSNWKINADEIIRTLEKSGGKSLYQGTEEISGLLQMIDTEMRANGYTQIEIPNLEPQQKIFVREIIPNYVFVPEEIEEKNEPEIIQIKEQSRTIREDKISGNFDVEAYDHNGGTASMPGDYVSQSMNLKGVKWVATNEDAEKMRIGFGNVEKLSRTGMDAKNIAQIGGIPVEEVERRLQIIRRGEVSGVLRQIKAGGSLDAKTEQVYAIVVGGVSNPIQYAGANESDEAYEQVRQQINDLDVRAKNRKDLTKVTGKERERILKEKSDDAARRKELNEEKARLTAERRQREIAMCKEEIRRIISELGETSN